MSVHVACVRLPTAGPVEALAGIPTTFVWSETMSTAATTTAAAPTTYGAAFAFVVTTLGETNGVNLAFGTAPDASNNPRHRQANNLTMVYLVNGGDKLAWTVVS